MKLYFIDYEIITGFSLGFEFVKGSWLNDYDEFNYLSIDVLCFRVLLTFGD